MAEFVELIGFPSQSKSDGSAKAVWLTWRNGGQLLWGKMEPRTLETGSVISPWRPTKTMILRHSLLDTTTYDAKAFAIPTSSRSLGPLSPMSIVVLISRQGIASLELLSEPRYSATWKTIRRYCP